MLKRGRNRRAARLRRRAPRASTKARTTGGRLRRMGPRGPVLRTLPRPGHERRFAAHGKPRTSCPALKTTFRPLFMPNRAAFAARVSAVRAGQWLSCSFVSGRRPGSCPGDGRGPKDRPAWPTGGAERSRSAKSGGRAGPCGSAARPAPSFRDLARSAAWRGPRKHDNPRNACLRLPYATESIGVALSGEFRCISMGW